MSEPSAEQGEIPRTRALLVAALLFIGALRIATLGAVPLIDKSEARYAEIGRQMVATGDWVTPRLEPDHPYWGKPPLHFWGTALGLRSLGFSEVAARLPSLLGALVVLLVTERVARRLRGAEVAPLACLILASCGLFFTLAAQVALDLTLTACTSIALGGFFLAHGQVDPSVKRRLHWLGFLALGAGLLAKGPVVLALWAGTLALATLLARDLRWLRGVPWFSGCLLAACVSLPWFLAAERSTPGFLWYFFVQENFLRFVVSEYGDLYGHGHTLPYGTIWGFALLALLPWSPALLLLAWRGLRTGALARLKEDPSRAFLLAWSVAPLAFFTPSRNVVVTYVLPALPAIAVLLADGVAARTTSGNTEERAATASRGLAASLLLGDGIVLVGVAVGLAVLAQQVRVPGSALALLGALLAACAAGLVSCARNPRRVRLIVATALCVPLIDAGGRLLLAREIGALASTRDLVASVRAIQRERRCELAFFREVPFSARFYLGEGGLSLEGDRSRLDSLASASECRLVAVRRRDLRRLDADALRGLNPVRDFGSYVLFGNAAAVQARARIRVIADRITSRSALVGAMSGMLARVSRLERGLRIALAVALALALAHPVYRALHLGVEYYDGYDYLRNARALVGDPLLEYQPLRPPFVAILQTPAMAIVRASPPADPIRLIAPHLTAAAVSILSAGGVLWLLSRTLGATLALLGTLLFVTTRYFVHYAPHAMADLPSAGWAAATIALYLRARERRSHRAFALCGLALGCSVLTKYPLFTLGAALLLSELWLAALARRIDRRCWRGVAIACGLGAMFFFGVQLLLMWIIAGRNVFQFFANTLRIYPKMSGAGEVPGESWLDYGSMTVTMLSLPTLLLAGAGILLALRRREARDVPCLAALAATGGTTLFLLTHTEARYLLPAVPFLLYFALRSVETVLRWARQHWQGWDGLRRGAAIAIGALSLAAALRVGLHQAMLEEDPLYRADLERRAAERLLAARGPEGRLLWYGFWRTRHTGWAGLLPHDEFFGVFHLPEFVIPYFLDRGLDKGPPRWPANPDKLALVLKDGDAVLRTSDRYYDARSLPPLRESPMEVWSARSLRFRAETDLEFVAATDPALRIRLQPDGRGGVLSASPLGGRWQILVRSAPDAPPRFAGTVTLAPGVAATFALGGRAPVREIELFQIQAARIE